MIWLTEIEAVDPVTDELCTWAGPRIEADTEEEAQNICLRTHRGYCKVIGRFIAEIDVAQINIEICPN
jgi:hypothetical protein